MTAEQIFSIANTIALASWLLLAILPHKAWVPRLLTGLAVPAVLAALYTGILAVRFAAADGGFSSLADVARLFSDPWLLLAGWVHYLAFDLLIGTWEVQDARTHGVPHVAVVPCLALTFLFGPAGWGSYMLARAMFARRLTPQRTASHP